VDQLKVEGQAQGDRLATAAEAAFTALLQRTYDLLQRPALHSHVCCSCGLLRPCVQQPCAYRATDRERNWDCGCQSRHADSDGDCNWAECPQEANNRANYQTVCPLWKEQEDE
jgi:hypothetical protein